MAYDDLSCRDCGKTLPKCRGAILGPYCTCPPAPPTVTSNTANPPSPLQEAFRYAIPAHLRNTANLR